MLIINEFKGIIIILTIVIIMFVGCNSNSTSVIYVNKNDEKTILNYLDTKTGNINSSSDGKIYSYFKLLGTDKNKIYIWLVQSAYKSKDNDISECGGGLSMPLVLNAKKVANKLLISSHNAPEDGQNYNESVRKLFPSKIKFLDNYNSETQKLFESARNRAQLDLTKK